MSVDLHWRNTQKSPRFFMLDARAVGALLLCMMYIRLWTIVLAVLSMSTFYIFERMGLSFASALRAMRSYLLGRNRPANHRRAIRRWVDYG